MPRLLGVDIPNDKSIWISLTYIVGVGKHTSEQILKEARIEKDVKAGKLSEDDLRGMIKDAIQEQGASGMKDMGKVMKALMVKAKGQVDGKVANNIVKEMLEG